MVEWLHQSEEEGPAMAQHTVYILLTRSGTWFSRLIHLATADDFTHASIGLEGPAGPFYSFARKNPATALPAGLVEERAGRGFFRRHPSIPCALYALEVDTATYAALERKVKGMYERREEYHYNLLGALSCFFRLPIERRGHYFCSEFVAEVLVESGAAQLGRDPCLTRPMDLCRLTNLRPVHRGLVGELAGNVA